MQAHNAKNEIRMLKKRLSNNNYHIYFLIRYILLDFDQFVY